jgi:hypothetical protein
MPGKNVLARCGPVEDDIPKIAQAKRLGHRLPGVRGV